jgi:hypothetical protein
MSTGGSGTPDVVEADSQDSRDVQDARDAAAGQERDRPWRGLRTAGLTVVGVQLLVSLSLTTFLFHRFHLIEDFGIFNQAWTLIGQGHLNPYNSIYGFPFYKSHFELIMWPLALTHVLYAQPVVLLWFQALTAAATELVVFFWILEHLERREVPRRVVVGVGCAVLAVILVNPLLWSTVSFDFHFESTATLFAVLAARALYRGRCTTAWIWIGMTLLCGDVAALYVVGVGLSALLAGRSTRRQGLLIIAAGLAWLAMISLIGANLGSSMNDYAYLAGRTTLPAGGGIALVVVGALTHPGRAFHVVGPRLHALWDVIEPAGVIGLASAWGFGVPAVVLVSSVLNSSPVYIEVPFQNFAVFPFLLFGTVSVLVWVADRLSGRWAVPVVVGVLFALIALVTGVNSSHTIVRTAVHDGATASQAAVLRAVLQRTPGDAEVASSLRVVGRFSSRQFVYLIGPSTAAIPVNARELVVVVAVTSGIDATQPDQAASIVSTFTRRRYPTQVLANSDGIYAFKVTVPTGVSTIGFGRAAT